MTEGSIEWRREKSKYVLMEELWLFLFGFSFLVLPSSYICTTHNHPNWGNQRHHTLPSTILEFHILVRCFSWRCSKRENKGQEKWWILRWRTNRVLVPQLVPRLFSLGELNLKHIMGYSLEFIHSKHFHF